MGGGWHLNVVCPFCGNNHDHFGGEYYEAILCFAPCDSSCNKSYVLDTGGAEHAASSGRSLEIPQPPVSAAAGFEKVFNFISDCSRKGLHLKILSPFVDVPSLIELSQRSRHAATVAICTRRNQTLTLGAIFFSIGSSTVCC